MKQMVINISPTGEVNHTLKDAFFKPDFGTSRNVQRMSDIVHDSASDNFYVRRMDGRPFVIERIDNDLNLFWGTDEREALYGSDLGCVVSSNIPNSTGVVPLWPTYEEAVAFEVRLIDAYRLAGKPIPGFGGAGK